jgi:hypothetical protein
MTYRNISNSNSLSSSPSANSSTPSSGSLCSFSHVLLALIKRRVVILIATCLYPDAVKRTPKYLRVILPNARLNSSPAYGPYISLNKYSDSRWSNTQVNGRTRTKYWVTIWLTISSKYRIIYSVFPLLFRALSYIVKKYTRPLIIYKLRAEYILLLTLIDPNSGPRAGCPPNPN